MNSLSSTTRRSVWQRSTLAAAGLYLSLLPPSRSTRRALWRMPGLLCYIQTMLSTSAGQFAGLLNKLGQFDALSEYLYVSKQAWLDWQETEAGVQLQSDSDSYMCVPSPR